MLIDTQEQFDKIPDFTELTLIQTGDAWLEGKGKTYKVIKMGDRLREVLDGGWLFFEKDDVGQGYDCDDFSFILIK